MKNLLVLAVLALAAGCGGSSDSTAPGGGAPNVVGSYTLQTVAGIAVPGVLLANYQGAKIEVLDDAYTLNADHTWSEHGTLRATDLTSGAVTTAPESDNGTYVQNNTTLVFTSPTNGQATASLTGSTLTVSDNGIPMVYRKN